MRLRSDNWKNRLRSRETTAKNSAAGKRERVVFKVKPGKRKLREKKSDAKQSKDRKLRDESKDEKKDDSAVAIVLSACQQASLQLIRDSAKLQTENKLAELKQRASNLGYSAEQLQQLLVFIRDKARLLIHFPTDTLPSLLADTHYRSQWESGWSVRSLQESRIFSNAYDSATPFERPKYGSLDFFGRANGNSLCHGYGECYLILRNETVRHRTSITPRDSYFTSVIGTLEHSVHVLCARNDADLRVLLNAAAGLAAANAELGDQFIEAQIHGELLLSRDVEAIVLSPTASKDCITRQLAENFAANNRDCRIVLQ